MKGKRLLIWAACVVLTEVIGSMSALFAGDIASKYQQMTHAPFSPPSWVFGIVWPVLYLMMGSALYFLLQSGSRRPQKTTALVLFFSQLLLNFTWSIIFFGANSLWLAVVNILLLDVLVFLSLRYFRHVSRMAFLFMIPYFVWICFATYLNIAFAILN